MVRSKSALILILLVSEILISQESPNRLDVATSPLNSNSLPDSMRVNLPVENPSEEVDRRKSVLLNGIDSEVATILTELRREKNEKYNDVLKDILQETRNSSIATGIYSLWEETSYKAGLVIAENELVKVVDELAFEPATVKAAMSYLAKLKHFKSQNLLIEIVDNRNSEIATSAVRAIGLMGGAVDAARIKRLLDKLKAEDPFVEEELVAALIVALGDLRYGPAADELIAIVDDASIPAVHRRFACISVGKIGRIEDYEVIERIYYETDDANLRSYALAGLAEFPNRDDITAVLIQALKRDSFWRIRMIAAEKLSESDAPGVRELLRYKIVNDPVKQVRIASVHALGKSSNRRDWNFLIEYFVNSKNPSDIRLASFLALTENRIPGTEKAVFSIMDRLWKEDKERFLEFICLEASKIEWAALATVYERMLNHENWVIQVYGIRGIRRNNIVSLMNKINSFDREGIDERVRREVRHGG